MKNWHSFSVKQVLSQTCQTFISDHKRKIRQNTYGKNKLEEKKKFLNGKNFFIILMTH